MTGRAGLGMDEPVTAGPALEIRSHPGIVRSNQGGRRHTFAGDLPEQKRFLDQAGISHEEPWTAADTEQACTAWNAYIVAKRQARAAKRPIADMLIGGFAANRTGLVTRNPQDFSRWFPRLKLRIPRVPSGSP
ncbi:MAG: hypothetical protein PHE83_02015 [Opitutaceae bacterium]|nr:hypothetical protein [Opitutaceae bacterium]